MHQVLPRIHETIERVRRVRSFTAADGGGGGGGERGEGGGGEELIVLDYVLDDASGSGGGEAPPAGERAELESLQATLPRHFRDAAPCLPPLPPLPPFLSPPSLSPRTSPSPAACHPPPRRASAGLARRHGGRRERAGGLAADGASRGRGVARGPHPAPAACGRALLLRRVGRPLPPPSALGRRRGRRRNGCPVRRGRVEALGWRRRGGGACGAALTPRSAGVGGRGGGSVLQAASAAGGGKAAGRAARDGGAGTGRAPHRVFGRVGEREHRVGWRATVAVAAAGAVPRGRPRGLQSPRAAAALQLIRGALVQALPCTPARRPLSYAACVAHRARHRTTRELRGRGPERWHSVLLT